MGFYNADWARKIVNHWVATEPLAGAMVDQFLAWEAARGTPDPVKFVTARLIHCLQTSKNHTRWTTLKACAKQGLYWIHAYELVIRSK